MRVSIVGTGYVGLVSGVCLAEAGHPVTCVDVDPRRVQSINDGDTPFHEAGLRRLLRRNLSKRFTATDDLERAVLRSDLTVIAVGTPSRGRRIDLGAVRAAASQIGRALAAKKRYHVVVVKSTVVPGTTDTVVLPLLEAASGRRAGRDFGVGMNPEFLSEGQAVRDFMHPDRIVLGGIDARTIAALDRLYRPFAGVPVLRTNPRTAEMIKYASNALLATLISFSNEIGDVCEATPGVDCEDVMEGMHLSQYLTSKVGRRRVLAPISAFLRPGCGFGGSCLPKDVNALVGYGSAAGCRTGLLREVMAINARRAERMLSLLRRHFDDFHGLPVAVLGLAFKPGTDDLRESPAIPIVASLVDKGAQVRVFDPVAMPAARRARLFDGASFADTMAGAVETAKAVVLVTAWPEFRALERLSAPRRRSLVIVDGRRVLERHRFGRYEGIGLGAPEGGRLRDGEVDDE